MAEELLERLAPSSDAGGGAAASLAGRMAPLVARCMAPEVAAGAPHDGKPTDVWSLGVLLCNLLGEPVLPVSNTLRTLALH